LKNCGLEKVTEDRVQEREVHIDRQEQLLRSVAPPLEYKNKSQKTPRSAGEWFDASIALASLVLAFPLILFAALLAKLADGGPVLWLGERLGKDRKPFIMYKIRSLAIGAEDKTAGRLVTPSMAAELDLEHRYGRFLRDSREANFSFQHFGYACRNRVTHL